LQGFAVGIGPPGIDETDQELTDILGADTNLIYHFIGEGKTFTQGRIAELIIASGIPANRVDDVLRLMVYSGFLGIHIQDNGVKYIFDVRYDMKLMQVLISKAGADVSYALNPAFDARLNFRGLVEIATALPPDSGFEACRHFPITRPQQLPPNTVCTDPLYQRPQSESVSPRIGARASRK
jgi:hypothetical protein